MSLFSGVIALVLVPFFLIYILIDRKKFVPLFHSSSLEIRKNEFLKH